MARFHAVVHFLHKTGLYRFTKYRSSCYNQSLNYPLEGAVDYNIVSVPFEWVDTRVGFKYVFVFVIVFEYRNFVYLYLIPSCELGPNPGGYHI